MSATFVTSLRRLLLAALVAAVVVAIPGVALAGQWDAPQSLPAGSQIGATVIDDSGIVTTVWSQEVAAGGCSVESSAPGCEVRVSRLGGDRWGDATTLSTADASSNGATVVAGSDGTVTALWLQTDGAADGSSVWVSRFTNGTWSPAKKLSTVTIRVYYTKLAVNSDGVVLAVWSDGTDSTQTARFEHGAWTTAETMPTSMRSSSYINAIVTSPDQSFTVLTRQTPYSRIGVSRLAAGVWADQGLITPPHTRAYEAAAVVDANGTVTVAWDTLTAGHYVVQSARRVGAVWTNAETPEVVSTTPDNAQTPRLVVNGEGVVTMVWRATHSTSGGDTTRLQYAFATNGSWSEPADIAGITAPVTSVDLVLDETSIPFLIARVNNDGWRAESLRYVDTAWSTPQVVVPGSVWDGFSFAMNRFGSGVAIGFVRGTPYLYQSARFGDQTAPAAPTAAKATVEGSKIVAQWTASAGTSAPPVITYTATATPGGAHCTSADSTQCTISGLTPGTTYRIAVTATNAWGTSASSLSSEPVTVPLSTSGKQKSSQAVIATNRIVVTTTDTSVALLLPVRGPGPGRVTITGTATRVRGARRDVAAKTAMRCTVSARFKKSGTRSLSCVFPARVRSQLRVVSLRVTLVTVFKPTTGASVQSVASTIIRRHRATAARSVTS